jgi:RHS repeat-associated protein
MQLLQSIILPNGTSWSFNYNSYLDLSQITFPTGGTLSYTWATQRLCPVGSPTYMSRWVASRALNANDGTGIHTWTYGWNFSSSYLQAVTVTDPVGNDTVHTLGSPTGSCSIYETETKVYQGSSATGTLLKTTDITYTGTSNPWDEYTQNWTSINVVPTQITTTWPNGKVRQTQKVYDSGNTFSFYDPSTGISSNYPLVYGSLLQDTENDYGLNSPGPVLRKTVTTYKWIDDTTGTYKNLNLIAYPSSVTIQDGIGNQQAQTLFTYDGSSLVASGITTQRDANPPTGTTRGNLTSVSRWLNKTISGTTITPTSSNIVSSNVYYDTGTVYQSTDPLGHTTTFSYSPSFAGAYVTQTQFPDTTSPNLAHHIISGNYDFNTGLLTSFTDENGNTSSYGYDNMFRITTATFPPQNGINGVTNFYYPDPNTVERTQKIDGTRNTDLFVRFDGVGREMRRITANGESSPWDQVDTCYDARGKVSFVSYPYQGTGLSMAQVCSGAGDSFTYDALGRTTAVTHSDGTSVQTAYAGAATQVSDEGNGTRSAQRVSQADGLGRLTLVCELTGATQLGITSTPAACGQDIAATGFLTSYSYDPLGNLLSVSQGGLNPRTFTYDSLSRLLVSTNPESGNIWYNYNNDGLVTARIHPAPNQINPTVTVSIAANYDPLHRLSSLSYSDATPGATYNYDESSARGVVLTNTIGRKSSERTAGASPTGEVFSYDSMGRVLNNSQCTPQNCGTGFFPVSYNYDLVGDITSATNGLGTMTYSYNVAPRLTTISSSLSDANHPGTLLSGVHYNAFAAQTSASLGNGLGESLTYYPRGWLQSLSVGISGSTYNLSLTYAADGDVLTANDSVNGNWTYAYDDFNRLISASKTGQAFSYDYDRFGNRWHQNVTAGTGPMSSLGFDANNHITSGSGVSYDAAGNVTNDGVHSYTYDAENRIVAVDSGATASYVYNAEGLRVRKTTASGSVDYLYDLGGHVVTEVSATGTWNRGEVYAGGRHVATYNNGTIYFIHADWLGTERARTGVSGSTTETCTSLPFGDSQTCTSIDPSPLHFTGKQRDTESNLDDFGARYYNSGMARWVTPDWSARGEAVPYADLANPQTLNLYAYVGNNPTTRMDADGHDCVPCKSGEGLLGHGDGNTGTNGEAEAEAAYDQQVAQAAAQQAQEHTGPFSLVQDWLDVIEVSGSYGLGASVSGQAGGAEGRAGVGAEVEGTIGLGGGNGEVTAFAGAQVSGKAGPAEGEIKAGITVSSKDGVSIGGEAHGAVGPVGGTVKVDRAGVHADAGGQKTKDTKLGAHVHAGVGVGVNINFSQVGRAYQNTVRSFNALGQYLMSRFVPNGLP